MQLATDCHLWSLHYHAIAFADEGFTSNLRMNSYCHKGDSDAGICFLPFRLGLGRKGSFGKTADAVSEMTVFEVML